MFSEEKKEIISMINYFFPDIDQCIKNISNKWCNVIDNNLCISEIGRIEKEKAISLWLLKKKMISFFKDGFFFRKNLHQMKAFQLNIIHSLINSKMIKMLWGNKFEQNYQRLTNKSHISGFIYKIWFDFCVNQKEKW